jgi:hypothetical protein
MDGGEKIEKAVNEVEGFASFGGVGLAFKLRQGGQGGNKGVRRKVTSIRDVAKMKLDEAIGRRNSVKGKATPSKYTFFKHGLNPPMKFPGPERTECPVGSLEVMRTRSDDGNGLCVASAIDSSTKPVTPTRSGWRNAATMFSGEGLDFQLPLYRTTMGSVGQGNPG